MKLTVAMLGFFFLLTQHQVYLNPNGSKMDGATLNRGSSTTYDGCMSQARGWANSFRGYTMIPKLDGFHLSREHSLGLEVVELTCVRVSRP
jgi:hypothetical protein